MAFFGIIAGLLAVIWAWFVHRKRENGRDDPSRHAILETTALWSSSITGMGEGGATEHASLENAYQTPINFYGKVVDQDGVPIAGADVICTPNDSGSGPTKNEVHLLSDANGLFSAIGLHGISLGVAVKKPGYFQPRSLQGGIGWTAVFGFAVDLGGGRHHPRRDAPVVFHLYKPTQTEPLTHFVKRNIEMPRDGAPVLLEVGRVNNVGPLMIQCRCWTHDSEKSAVRHYDWRFEIKIIDGGLRERTDDYEFLAPASEYRESDGCEMSKEMPPGRWRRNFKKDYFVRFDNGIYGRLYVEMLAYGGHTMCADCWINPQKGSRKLEAEPVER